MMLSQMSSDIVIRNRRWLELRTVLGYIIVASLLLADPILALKCVICTSERDDACITKPGSPTECATEMQYCITMREYVKKNETKNSSQHKMLDLPGNPDDIGAHIPVNSPILEEKYHMVFLARSCVKFQGGDTCYRGKKDGKNLTICHEFCSVDNCNSAWKKAGPPFLIVLMTLLSMV